MVRNQIASWAISSLLLIYQSRSSVAQAQQAYTVELTGVTIEDASTGYADVDTMFKGQAFNIFADVQWNSLELPASQTNVTVDYKLKWTSFVNDVQVGTGEEMVDVTRSMLEQIGTGTGIVEGSGTNIVKVVLEVEGQEDSTTEAEREYQSFAAGASFVPLIIILFLAVTTHEVYISLGMGIFVGACMVTGNVRDGFKSTLDRYILEALADVDHGYVILFTLFMSGFVGILEKSGGIIGFTRWISRFATTQRAGQIAAFCTGLIIFFDDYANILIAGPCMKPMFDSLMLSSEKLAFMVDATAAPVASLTPISSWIGFEVSLIQAEIEKLLKLYPEGLTVDETGFGVFLQTIAYRYYPIFMLFTIVFLSVSQRDFGPMLVAERKCRVYGRTDGGDGSSRGNGGPSHEKSNNAPEPDSPLFLHNFLIPVIFLIFYVFYFLVVTGEDGTGTQTFLEIMQGSDSYSALLWGTLASALTALALYFVQFHVNGKYAWPSLASFLPGFIVNKFMKLDDEQKKNIPKVLMNWRQGLEAFLNGMEKVFFALVLLVEAWAFGAVTTTVGLDRYFSNLIVNGSLGAEWLPTISFVTSLFIAFATGSSWSTMTIMFPLLMVPTYIKSDGDQAIFYATVAGVLSGSVAGDHASPVSDTTVLSSMSTQCSLLAHVRTQSPIVVVVSIWCVLVGTIPVGLESYSNGIAILMGAIFMLITVIGVGAPIFSATGRYDPFTELYMMVYKDEELLKLKEDCIRAFETGEPVKLEPVFDSDEESLAEKGMEQAAGKFVDEKEEAGKFVNEKGEYAVVADSAEVN